MNSKAKFLTKRSLNINQGTEIILESEGLGNRLTSVFVGMDANKYIIIQYLDEFEDYLDFFKVGNFFILKYFLDGKVFAFQSKILKILKDQSKILIMEYPKVVQDFSLRAHKRVKACIPFSTKLGKNNLFGILTDVSQSGCACILDIKSKTPPIIKIGDNISLLCQFPGVGNRQNLNGIIKNMERNTQKFFFGIEFSKDLLEESKEIIDHYIDFLSGF